MKIGTHNSVFHADDVFAYAILSLVFGKEIEIVRTRDEALLDTCDILIDVGGVCNPLNTQFDHHQEGGAGCRMNGVPYASAGLVWAHYWAKAVPAAFSRLGISDDGTLRKAIADKVDRDLIQGIDAADCGFKLFEGGRPVAGGIRGKSISAVIAGLNPTWLEGVHFDEAFIMAAKFAKLILGRAIASAAAVLMAEPTFLAACARDEGDPIVTLSWPLPWAHDIQVPEGNLFVVFPDADGTWRAQCVPPTPGSFDKRKPLPGEWAGKRGAELAEITGVEDAIFCHIGVWICGAVSEEGALALAKLALAE